MPDSISDNLSVSQTAYCPLQGMKRRPVDIVVGTSSFEERKKTQNIRKYNCS